MQTLATLVLLWCPFMNDDTLTSRPVTPEDLALTNDAPAVFSNRFIAQVNPAGMRITFGETTTTESATIFRNAVLLSLDDARALRDLIDVLLNRQNEPNVQQEVAMPLS
jgi:hypothetical protein